MKRIEFSTDLPALKRQLSKEIVRAIATMTPGDGIAPEIARVPGAGSESMIDEYIGQAEATAGRLLGDRFAGSGEEYIAVMVADRWPQALRECVERKISLLIGSLAAAAWLEGCSDKNAAETFSRRAATAATEIRRLLNERVRNQE